LEISSSKGCNFIDLLLLVMLLCVSSSLLLSLPLLDEVSSDDSLSLYSTSEVKSITTNWSGWDLDDDRTGQSGLSDIITGDVDTLSVCLFLDLRVFQDPSLKNSISVPLLCSQISAIKL
jgi:hypothetical protein